MSKESQATELLIERWTELVGSPNHTQDSVSAGLVPLALGAEPFEDIGIEADGQCFLIGGHVVAAFFRKVLSSGGHPE